MPVTMPVDGLPRLAVVTPSMNQSGFLEQTIRSVLLQGYPHLEYRVLDGGSTDGSVDVIRRYEERLTCWQSGPDGGQSAAINTGIGQCSAEIAGWLNSDDLYYPGALMAIGKAFAEHPDAGVVYGGGAYVDERGAVLTEIGYRPFDAHALTRKNYIMQPAMFFRRDLFLELGGLNVKSRAAMDWEFLLKAMRRTKIVAIDAKVAMFRKYQGTVTASKEWRNYREAGLIARDVLGTSAFNYRALCLKESVARIRHPLLRTMVRRVMDRLLAVLAGPHGYAIRGWPSDTELEALS